MKDLVRPIGSIVSTVVMVVLLNVTISAQGLSVREHPAFSNLTKVLQQLVLEKSRRTNNVFYVSHVREEVGTPPYAWVYWPAKNALIMLEQVNYDPTYALVWSRRFLDLRRDVVPTEDDIGGSDYLLSRLVAKSIVSSCERGDRFVIRRQLSKHR